MVDKRDQDIATGAQRDFGTWLTVDVGIWSAFMAGLLMLFAGVKHPIAAYFGLVTLGSSGAATAIPTWKFYKQASVQRAKMAADQAGNWLNVVSQLNLSASQGEGLSNLPTMTLSGVNPEPGPQPSAEPDPTGSPASDG